MDTKINYTVVGFIVVALATLFAVFILWWTSGLTRQTYNTYMIYMNQDVSGLTNQAVVKYNGVLVGNVTSVQLNLQDPQQVIVYARVQQNIPVTTSTVATLASQGITGVSYLSLSAKTPNAPLLTALPGQEYPVIPSEPSLTAQVMGLVKEAAVDFKEVSSSLKTIFNAKNTQNINEILNNVAVTSKEMPQMVSSVQNTAQSVGVLTNNMNQAMPSALELLDRLNQVSGNLTSVTGEMKQNPAVLLRGTTGQTLGPGE